MSKQPCMMTSAEFNQSFPLFTELSPRAKWRLYRISNKVNFQETGEECSYAEFVAFANSEDFRWDIKASFDEGMIIIDDHQSCVLEALKYGQDVPAEVLAEYPEMVEEFIKKKKQAVLLWERRNAKKRREKDDRDFWGPF